MARLIIFLTMVGCEGAYAQTSYFDLSKFALEYWRIDNNRDGYLEIEDPGGDAKEHWLYGSAATFDLDLVATENWGLYWDNYVHMDSTNKQVRHVGWEWEGGLRIGDTLEVFHYHHSRHILEAERPDRYPLVNRYGARWVFYEK